MASIQFHSVSKRYGDEMLALANVDLTVADGEFLVLLGPSGCGKSTLLRSVAGLESLTKGRILIGDRDVTGVDPADRDIAMVFQDYALYPHMSVYENMAFGLRQRKVDRETIRQKVMSAAEALNLEPYLDRRPAVLSGGQRQRVAMGRAMVRNPACFLMDEPLSNLDAKLRVRMRTELKELTSSLGATTIYVTHDQVEAMTMGDRIAVMSPVGPDQSSNLQQCATPKQLYARPRNLFVAGFIGSPPMNFVKVGLGRIGDRLVARLAGGGENAVVFDQPADQRPELIDVGRKRVVLGARPESIEVIREGSDDAGGVEGRVTLSEVTGPDTFHFVTLLGYENALIEARDGIVGERLVVRTSNDISLGRGQIARFRIRPAEAHFFDAEIGINLEVS